MIGMEDSRNSDTLELRELGGFSQWRRRRRRRRRRRSRTRRRSRRRRTRGYVSR